MGLGISLPYPIIRVPPDGAFALTEPSGAIGLGVKGDLMEELVKLSEESSRAEVERGRALLKTGEAILRKSGAADVTALHRHGGIVETILEREASARLVVIGKRGASYAFASDHIGSKIERVVRASAKPVLVASRRFDEPRHVVFAYDASPAAERALEWLANSPLFASLPITIVMAEAEGAQRRAQVDRAVAAFATDHPVSTVFERGRAELVIPEAVAANPGSLLLMGAYGHSPIRRLIVGSTTTEMIRSVKAPVLLVR